MNFRSHTYNGNPVFVKNEDENTIQITNDSHDDKGSWIGWYDESIDEGDRLQVIGDWSGGEVRFVIKHTDGSYSGVAIDNPNDWVTIPADVERVRLDLRLWGRVGTAIASDLHLLPEDVTPPEPDDPLPYFVDFPDEAMAGAFTIFWGGPTDVYYTVSEKRDVIGWVALGNTTEQFWDVELLLEDIGMDRTFKVSYLNSNGDPVESAEATVNVIERRHPLPDVPSRVGIPFSGWLFRTDLLAIVEAFEKNDDMLALAAQIPEDAPILSIFDNVVGEEAAGAPVTGHIYGRTIEATIGSPEYLVEPAIPCEDTPEGCEEEEPIPAPLEKAAKIIDEEMFSTRDEYLRDPGFVSYALAFEAIRDEAKEEVDEVFDFLQKKFEDIVSRIDEEE